MCVCVCIGIVEALDMCFVLFNLFVEMLAHSGSRPIGIDPDLPQPILLKFDPSYIVFTYFQKWSHAVAYRIFQERPYHKSHVMACKLRVDASRKSEENA